MFSDVVTSKRKNNDAKLHYRSADIKISKKGKAIPLQAWTDLEGSRSLRLPDFKTIGT